MDWESMFVPTIHLGEIVLRGTAVYLFLFFLLRFVRRQAGSIGISDLLVLVLIADAAQNAMSSDYHSITEGVVLVATIVGWDYLLDWAAYKSPLLRRLLRPAPLLLIRDGQMQRQNMRREMMDEAELLAHLRESGVERADEVRRCYLEEDGHLSIIKKKRD